MFLCSPFHDVSHAFLETNLIKQKQKPRYGNKGSEGGYEHPYLSLTLTLSLTHTHTHTPRTLQGTLFKREICATVLWDSHRPCTERATLSCAVTITETTEEIKIARSFVMMTLPASHSLTPALNVCCSTVSKLILSCLK